MSNPTAKDVAARLQEEFEQRGVLPQERAVRIIKDEFGAEFVYKNENGNPAIDRKVLREFRKLTDGSAAWDRSEKAWRPKRFQGRVTE
jgi:hypothetical protein